jgi:hypothetical protein
MAQWGDKLFSMRGRVIQFRPGVSKDQVDGWINDRIRQAIDSRIFWSDLLQPGLIAVPDMYNTGTATTANGSGTVAGTLTAWPIDDKVNTTLAAAVDEIGYFPATPTSMTGITADTILLVDNGGSNQEVVPVIRVDTTQFIGKFSKYHDAGETITCSSLVGRQFRVSSSYPIFTVQAVTSATSLLLDNPWSSTGLTDVAYQIIGMYYTLATDIKDILTVVDTQYGGWPLRYHVSISELNWRDPQRTSFGPPQMLADLAPNACGNMQYELWPTQYAARQVWYLYRKQWPELVNDNDVPPWFINPMVFVHGAIADALRWRKGKEDPFFNPDLAEVFERKFLMGLDDAKNADESKSPNQYSFDYTKIFGAGGANFWVSHDPDVWNWEM